MADSNGVAHRSRVNGQSVDEKRLGEEIREKDVAWKQVVASLIINASYFNLDSFLSSFCDFFWGLDSFQ